MRLEIGSVVNRSYRLLHPIGEGGTARVWVAEQLALERRVAIKILSDETIRNPATLELFQREARATARVDHPHVVRIVDFGISEEGSPFLVFELLVGETLEQRLRRSAIDLDEARLILGQTCDALGFAHERGILHRDIKAENLYLQQARAGGIDVKLLDFGIATRKSAPLAGEGISGTPAYMSPEQLECGTIDERGDLFALGVCIYYALSKHFPYPADTAAEAARSFAVGTFVPISMLRPELPKALDDWFEKALAIDRSKRFADAMTMFMAFERARESSHDGAVAVDVSSILPKRPLPWGKAALFVGAALVAFAQVTPRHPQPIAHASPIATPTAAHVVAPPPPVIEIPEPADAEQTTIQAVPVETLPKTPAPPRFVWHPPPKPQAAKRVDASVDPIPEFGSRE